jgi:hypothetical protein
MMAAVNTRNRLANHILSGTMRWSADTRTQIWVNKFTTKKSHTSAGIWIAGGKNLERQIGLRAGVCFIYFLFLSPQISLHHDDHWRTARRTEKWSLLAPPKLVFLSFDPSEAMEAIEHSWSWTCCCTNTCGTGDGIRLFFFFAFFFFLNLITALSSYKPWNAR